MVRFPERITQDRYADAWQYARRKYCRARRKVLIEKLVTPLSNTLFLAGAIVLTYGVLYAWNQKELHDYLSGISFLREAWKWVSAFLVRPELPWYQQAGRILGWLYGMPFLAGAIVALLVVVFYHPKEPELPETGCGAALLALGKKICICGTKCNSQAVSLFNIAFILFEGVLISGFMWTLIAAGNADLLIGVLMEIMGDLCLYFNPLLLITAAVLVMFFGYAIVNYPFLLMMRCLHYCHIPKGMIPEMERYAAETEEKNERV